MHNSDWFESHFSCNEYSKPDHSRTLRRRSELSQYQKLKNRREVLENFAAAFELELPFNYMDVGSYVLGMKMNMIAVRLCRFDVRVGSAPPQRAS